MASNSFGNIFKITTWGESHGKAIGVVIDGCPAGIEINESELNAELALRSPGINEYTSPRKESDQAEILSGIFQGQTTGAPICILIPNRDPDSSKYESIKHLMRPGHANYTYLEKYGIFDYRGGGRASARETAGRVAAGAVAKKFLSQFNIQIAAYIKQIGAIEADCKPDDLALIRTLTYSSPVYCPDRKSSNMMAELIDKAKAEGDSIGGIIEFVAINLPVGLGDPIYEKLEANLASAMLSIPASKGFEIGSGFNSAFMSGSDHNDLFVKQGAKAKTKTNFAGGTLGGISTGMPLTGKVGFKPTSSIMQQQETLTVDGEQATLQLPAGSRHDPCVAIRAVPIVEAMVALVLTDAILYNRCVKI
jgi:chorismate synthase